MVIAVNPPTAPSSHYVVTEADLEHRPTLGNDDTCSCGLRFASYRELRRHGLDSRRSSLVRPVRPEDTAA